MKKAIVLAAALIIGAASVNAQSWYVGTSNIGITATIPGVGTEGFSLFTGVTSSGGTTLWGIAPEFGYNINDTWTVGLGIGYSHFGKKTALFGVNPYVRWYGYRAGNFGFYVQGNVKYTTAMGDGWGLDKTNMFGISINPGVQYNISDRFAITASFGELGWSKIKNTAGIFDLNVDGTALKFGLTYSF